jgi:uncharacterized protein (TIGR02594 family)
MTGPAWMPIALGELGTLEIPGDTDNPRIVLYHQATKLRATDDETPWCASFVNWCLAEAKVEPTRSALARSYLPWGVACGERYGAVAVLSRGGNNLQGHLGFLVDATPAALWLLGGNQGNRVSLARFERTRLLGLRWPHEADRAGAY